MLLQEKDTNSWLVMAANDSEAICWLKINSVL